MRNQTKDRNIPKANEQECAEYLMDMCTGIASMAQGMGQRGEMISYLARMMVLELETVLEGKGSFVAPPVREKDRREKDKALVALLHYMNDE